MPTTLTAGTIFDGRYEVLSYLGEGGMCVVYKARHLEMQRDVALKFLHRSLLSDANAILRFQREAKAAADLDHPNIIKMYGFGSVDGSPYIAMELIEGTTLSALLQSETRLPADKAIPIFNQILDALDHAHSRGVLHRDLKPSNVMLCGSKGTVKLLDFGIAKILPESGKELQKLTQTGQLLGTILYMSPEQCEGRSIDARSDIYSMGCLMYESLDGQPPFSGDNPFMVLNKHVVELPRQSQYLNGDLAFVILSCLEKDPQKRPASAAQLKVELADPRAASADRRSTKVAHKTPSWINHRSTLLAVAAASVVMAGGIFWFLMAHSYKEPSEKDPAVARTTADRLTRQGLRKKLKFPPGIALPMFTKAIESDPSYAPAYICRGNEYLETGQMDAALSDVNKAISLDEKIFAGYLLRARVLAGKSDYENAIIDDTRAISLSPNAADPYLDRARYHICRKELNEAMNDLHMALQRKDHSPSLFRAFGEVHSAWGEHKKAIEDFRRAVLGWGDNPAAAIDYDRCAQEEDALGMAKEAAADRARAAKARLPKRKSL